MGTRGEGDTPPLVPFNPDSLVRKVVSVKDRTIFNPAPTEDGAYDVPDAKIWARLQATVRKRKEAVMFFVFVFLSLVGRFTNENGNTEGSLAGGSRDGLCLLLVKTRN